MKSVHKYLTERLSSVALTHSINSLELIEASYNDDFEKVEDLLKEGVNPNSVDSNGNSAITKWGTEKKILDALLKAGADINHQNKDGETVLHNNAHRLDEEDVEYLLSKGAKKDIVANKGLPSTYAHYDRNYDIMELLKTADSTKDLIYAEKPYGANIHSYSNKETVVEIASADLEDYYEESRGGGVSKEVFKQIVTQEIYYSDFDVDWEDHMDVIDDSNMTIIKAFAEKNGHTEDEDINEYLEDTEVSSAIRNAMESALRDEEIAYLEKEIDKSLSKSAITIDYKVDKAYITINNSDAWDKFKEDETEFKELFEPIATVYYPRYGAGYDEKNFNSILKDYLDEIV